MVGESDIDLVRRFVEKNDSEAFDKLVARHRGWILRVCRRFLRSNDLAEDAAQEVFARCLEKLPTLESQNLAGWLKAIAVNCCLNILEKEKRWTTLDDTRERGEDSVERSIIDSEKLERVIRCMEGLSDKQRIVFSMKYIDGRSYEEIQQLTGFTAKEVKSFLQNARRNFENMWAAEGGSRP